tara:strand:+ start:2181 stop:4061 length:1881 start_codon:yes stop_codon:yes gene_type:complete
MDKKNTLLGTIFLIAALGLMYWNSKQMAEAQRRAAEEAAANPPVIEAPAEDSAAPFFGSPATIVSDVPGMLQEVVPPPAPTSDEVTTVIGNSYFEATLTSLGGAIKTVALIARDEDGEFVYPIELDSEEPVVLHALAETLPFSLSQLSGNDFRPLALDFALIESSYDRVVFETSLPQGLVIRRTYELVEGEDGTPADYTIRHTLTVLNPGTTDFDLSELYLNIGTAAPTNADPYGMDLNASVNVDGKYKNIAASKFKSSFFSSAKKRVERTGSIKWAAVKNQFFTSIVTPETPGNSLLSLPVKYPTPLKSRKPSIGITSFIEFDFDLVMAGTSQSLVMDYYSGPKDFNRLKQMGAKQEDVMHFGWFMGMFLGIIAFVGKALFSLLSFIHGLIGNWGFGIILMTLVVRLLLWPLTAKAARSSKRMQELQKPMAALKEKFKDSPQKQQQATLELFKKHKINPLSGCWPLLLQFPIFIAMFNLLRNTSDLRFAEFLWITDLSMPDASIPLGDFALGPIKGAINVLPFIWLVSMWFQMKMMPQPSVDNAQVKIIKYMPFIFFPMTYFFSSGLVLYWTTTNGFSIFQAWMTKRSKDSEDIAIEAEILESEEKKTVLKTGPIPSKKKKRKNP